MQKTGFWDQPIGVFDSGLGGLTVVLQLEKYLPSEQIIYCADSLHLPYGEKSVEQIQKYTLDCVSALIKKKIKVLLIACHTAAIPTKKLIEEKFSIPVFGIQEASLEALLSNPNTKRVGVIGTEATIRSNYYAAEISKKEEKIQVEQVAAPTLVPLIENEKRNSKKILEELQKYREKFSDQKMDTLLFACTHYPLILPLFEKIFPSIKLVDPSFNFVDRVTKFLDIQGLRSRIRGKKSPEFWVTGDPKQFQTLASHFLSYVPKKVFKLSFHKLLQKE